MATTLWNEATIHPSSPKVLSTCRVTAQSRSGNTQKYTIKISMHCTDSASYYNNRWACKVIVGGKTIASNLTIKPQTSGTIGTTVYSKTCTGSITVSGNTGKASVSVQYWDTGFSTSLTGRNLANKSATIAYNPLSVVSLGISSYTHNSATFTWTYKNIAPAYVRVYANNTLVQTVYTTPFTITGLTPKTQYTFYANGYANGGYGSNGNKVTLTTYPEPVLVKSVSVLDIQPFQATVNVASSSAVDTVLIEYAVLDEDDTEVATWSSADIYTWTATNLTPETSYRFRIRMKTMTSNVYSDYVYSAYFSTPADQASIYIKENGVWLKGKTYKKNDGQWVPAKKAYIKDTDWIVGVNS